MLNSKIKDPFFEFLKGTHQSKSNTSLIKFLPKDVLEIILDNYIISYNLDPTDMIKYGLNNQFIKKFYMPSTNLS